MIPFSPPRIDQEIIDEVADTLRSGWITTGPKTKQFERELKKFCNAPAVLCVNSATAGLEMILRWYGVGEGDEVIVPAYTYTASVNVIIHCGATPVLIDASNDFNIDTSKIKNAITSKTKVIIPVDIGGWPCNYNDINSLVNDSAIKNKFVPANKVQKQLGRILVLSDAAHSLGAVYDGKKTGSLTDITVFSFHAVKNLTTAEGGAIVLNLPENFDHDSLYKFLNIYSLHGQTKDAFSKLHGKGNWRYDVIEAGYKCNMTDIQASMGLVEIKRYDSDTLQKRKWICNYYRNAFKKYNWAELPVQSADNIESSYHLFALRIIGINESQRDEIIQNIFNLNVAVNVHFIPIPLLTFYSQRGYKIEDYPVANNLFSREISLPVYYDLTEKQLATVSDAVIASVNKVISA
jgi:dTDP-4-amino-4,6-dideoxygalactose transaminase